MMKSTIRNRLILLCSCLLVLMAAVAAVCSLSLERLKRDAHEAIAVGARLHSIAIEIQVHNLKAQRRIKEYLAEVDKLGPEKARQMYLEESDFEIHEMETLAAKAAAISPDAGKRAKFARIGQGLASYRQAVDRAVGLATDDIETSRRAEAQERYALAADQLDQEAEDGEVAGSEASQSAEAGMVRTSRVGSLLSVGISVIGLAAGIYMSFMLLRSILGPVDHLRELADTASRGNFQLEVRRFSNDEIGDLSESFSRMLASVRFFQSKTEMLNEQLKAENLRMSAELDVTRRLQQMMLPRETEMSAIASLDISGYMRPAAEVGGDYYDVVSKDGGVFFGIGDVTGHGLESGVIGIILQTAVRTLLASGHFDNMEFFNILNRVICESGRRMNCDRILTFSLLHYQDGIVKISGQHEEIIVVRGNGVIERHDTLDLGFPLGLEEDISRFVSETTVPLEDGDVMVAYTDGITEAIDRAGSAYGVERLAEAVRNSCGRPSDAIRKAVLESLGAHVGEQDLLDDVSLLVIKSAGSTQIMKG
jgi:serine phosphatase RsbU (regulator of sigma subunit)